MARVLCTIFIRQNKNRDWKPGDGTKTLEHHTDRPEPARDQARPLGRRKGRRAIERDARRRGRRDRQRRQVRAHRGAEGVQGRPLRPEPDRQGRQARVEGAQTQGRGLRVRGHRTIPETRGECRGGPHRHVPGRREHPAGGRHQPIAVGRQDAVPDPERQAQEGVRGDRGVAHEAVGGRVPVRVHGRRVAQAFMGRLGRERQCPGRHRSQRGGAPRGDRRGRGHEGGQGQLGAVRPLHDRTRPEGRAPGGRRPVRRTRRHGRLDAAQGEIPAVHGAFHAQRALEDAADTPRMGVRRPQGHIRHGIPGIRPGQGRTGRHGDGIQEAQGRRELPARGRRRDDDLPAGRVPGRAPQEDPHEQHDRAAGQGDPPAHARGGRLPRREQRVDAHMRPHPSRHRERMVDPPLSRHVPAR